MKKLIESNLKKKFIALDEYTQVYKDETLESILEYESVSVDIENNDLLVEELYGKEWGIRVLFFGIQLDEMWTFVQNKANKQWLWLASNPANRQIVARIGGLIQCGWLFKC